MRLTLLCSALVGTKIPGPEAAAALLEAAAGRLLTVLLQPENWKCVRPQGARAGKDRHMACLRPGAWPPPMTATYQQYVRCDEHKLGSAAISKPKRAGTLVMSCQVGLQMDATGQLHTAKGRGIFGVQVVKVPRLLQRICKQL